MSSLLDRVLADPSGTASALSQDVSSLFRTFEFNTGLSQGLLNSTSQKLEFNYFFSWFIVFMVLYVLFVAMWRFVFPNAGLREGTKPMLASSRCIGTVHCSIVVPLSIIALNQRSTDWFSVDYAGVNTPLEYRVIELSVGYFVADFVHFILFERDLLMFFHHIFSILMMGSAGIIGRGGSCATGAIVQGEITNPLQSAWTVARQADAKRLSAFLSPIFTVAFVSVRMALVPYWTYNILLSLFTGPSQSALPGYTREIWSFMAFGMCLGGFAWSHMLIKGYLKQLKKAKVAAAEKNTKKKE